MDFTFLLMRNAHSTHNRHKDHWKNYYEGEKFYKQLPEYTSTKLNPALIDSCEIDLVQC